MYCHAESSSTGVAGVELSPASASVGESATRIVAVMVASRCARLRGCVSMQSLLEVQLGCEGLRLRATAYRLCPCGARSRLEIRDSGFEIRQKAHCALATAYRLELARSARAAGAPYSLRRQELRAVTAG